MKLLEIHNRTNHCVSIKEIQVTESLGICNSKLASCQPPVCASCVFGCAHKKPWKGKREREKFHQKWIRNSHRRQHISGRVDVKHSWYHPTNVRLLNLWSFLGGDSFCRPCHLVHVHPPTTRPNPHRGQSSTWENGSHLWHHSEEISHRQWNFCRGRF